MSIIWLADCLVGSLGIQSVGRSVGRLLAQSMGLSVVWSLIKSLGRSVVFFYRKKKKDKNTSFLIDARQKRRTRLTTNFVDPFSSELSAAEGDLKVNDSNSIKKTISLRFEALDTTV